MPPFNIYKFIHPTIPTEYIFAVSSWSESEVREYATVWDHGGMDYEIFAKIWDEGTVELITQEKELSEEDLGCNPYETEEIDDLLPMGYETCMGVPMIAYLSLLKFWRINR